MAGVVLALVAAGTLVVWSAVPALLLFAAITVALLSGLGGIIGRRTGVR